MPIQVKFFASLRERMGRGDDQIDASGIVTVAQVWESTSGGEPLPANILMAVNHEHADSDHPVQDGDEVAFFPPVTGG